MRITRRELEAIKREPDRVLAAIGVHMVAGARKSFREQQAPDGTPWPERYPNQTDDLYLNVAGALQDLRTGTNIKKRRYDKRPAGVDTGELRRRLVYDVRGQELVVGADVPYARRVHFGGESSIPLDAQLIANLAQLLRSKRRSAKRKARRDGTLGVRGGAPLHAEELRLGPVIGKYRSGERTWTTTSEPRPFFGLSQRDEQRLAAAIKTEARRLAR